MHTSLDNRKKTITNFPRSVLKRKNVVKEGEASCSRMKREQENTYLKAHKMMRGIMEPFIVPTMARAMPTVVKVMPIVVQAIRQIAIIP
jgi:hypothetical protein